MIRINKEHVNKVIAKIQEEDNFFNMDYISRKIEYTNLNPGEWSCETPSCIAGWAAFLSVGEDQKAFQEINDGNRIEVYAAEYLGGEYGFGDIGGNKVNLYHLFYPALEDENESVAYGEITRKETIKTLETLRDTNTYDWEHISKKARDTYL